MKTSTIKVLKLAATISLVVAVLVSCTFQNTTNEEEQIKNTILNNDTFKADFEKLEGIVVRFSQNVDLERQFFGGTYELNGEVVEDYEVFINSLELTFEELEAQFSEAHLSVLAGINNYEEAGEALNADEVNTLLEVKGYEAELVAMFTDFLQYHYMILETDLIMHMFEDKVGEMYDFTVNGNVTSNDYNAGLEALLINYSELMNTNSLMDRGEAYLGSDEEIVSVLTSVGMAKDDVLALETLTETDMEMNQMVYELFDYVEQSVTVMYAYVNSSKQTVYTRVDGVSIDNGAKAYYDANIEFMNNPFEK